MYKTYKYKIKPSEAHEELLNKAFGCARFVYNWGLKECRKAIDDGRALPSYHELRDKLGLMKQEESFKWLNDYNSDIGLQALKYLAVAFSRHKNGNTTLRFKSRKSRAQNAKFWLRVKPDFQSWTISIPTIGVIPMCKNRPFDQSSCKQLTTTITRDACGTYWCSILVVEPCQSMPRVKISKDSAIGIDLGIKDFAILSDGDKIANPKFMKKAETSLQHLHKALNRKQEGSKNYEKARMKLAKCHRAIANRRNDFIHKLTAKLVDRYDTICLETLGVADMVKNHSLAKSILDAAWAEFGRQIDYKAAWRGKNVLRIDRF